VTAAELEAARVLLLLLHEQADRNPRLRPRLAAFRTALACVEMVQVATKPHPPAHAPGLLRLERQRFAPTAPAPDLPDDMRPTEMASPAWRETMAATQIGGLR